MQFLFIIIIWEGLDIKEHYDAIITETRPIEYFAGMTRMDYSNLTTPSWFFGKLKRCLWLLFVALVYVSLTLFVDYKWICSRSHSWG